MRSLRNSVRLVAVLLRRRAVNIWLNGIVASEFVPEQARWLFLRASGFPVERSLIYANCFIGSSRVVIGRGSSLNRGVFLDGSADVVIGEKVSFGMNVLVITGSHEMGGYEDRAGGAFIAQPVRIEDGAWIGAGSIILPGVTIGRGAVVGVGSVVVKDVAENTVVMGNPARVIRRLPGAGEPARVESLDP